MPRPASVNSRRLDDMTTSQNDRSRRRWLITGSAYSLVIIAAGLAVSIATGEWIALVCAIGLVVVPVGAARVRSRRSPR